MSNGLKRSGRHLLLPSLLMGLVAVPIAGVGGRTPEARESPPAVAARTADTEQDAAVTLRLVGEPVVDLLPRLPRAGGPSLGATPDLGERRVDLFVRGLSEVPVRRGIARVVGGIWVRTHGGRILSLEPNPAEMREQAAALAQTKQRFFDGLRSLVRLLPLSPSALNLLQNPGSAPLTYLTRPDSRAAVQLLGLLSGSQWQELEATGRLVVYPEQLGPSGAPLVREYTRYLNEMHTQMQKASPAETLDTPTLDPDQTSRGPLVFSAGPQDSAYPPAFLSVGLGDEAGATAMTISGVAPATADTYAARWAGGAGAAPRQLPKGPRVLLAFKQLPTTWAEVLQQAADQLRLQIVSEEYTGTWPRAPLRATISGALPEVLDQLCAAFGYQWHAEGGIYEFRSSNWYVDRQQEPPGTLVRAALLASAEGRPLSLGWLAAAMAVPPDRMRKLWIYAPTAQGIIIRSRPLLEFYAALLPAQRKALETEAGLSPEALSPAQHTWLVRAAQRMGTDWPSETLAHASIRLVADAKSARFSITSDDRSTDATIPLPSPPVPAGGHPAPAPAALGHGAPGLSAGIDDAHGAR